MSKPKEFLRPVLVASLLGVTRSRVYQLIAAGEVPAVRVGGALRVPRTAWEAWLRDRSREALARVRRGQHAARKRGSARPRRALRGRQ